MKLSIFLLLFAILQSFGEKSYSQKQKVSLNIENATMFEIFDAIEKNTEYTFLFKDEDVSIYSGIDIRSEQQEVSLVLDKLFEDKRLTYRVTDNTIIINSKDDSAKEEQVKVEESVVIAGIVKDKSGEVIPGATVMIKGTSLGTVTDKTGKFTIPIKKDIHKVLIVSFIGMCTKEIPIDKTYFFNIELEADSESLNEVVVTGYQTLSRERVTGSFSVVKAKDMEEKVSSNIIERLEGITPGLTMHKGEYSIRGISTFGDNNKPLIVVDGFPIEGSIKSINPNDIEQITVLKDAASASIWGAKASNGVIVIVTKSGKKGNTKVNYSYHYSIDPINDYSYLDKPNSSETIDFEKENFHRIIIREDEENMEFTPYSKSFAIYRKYLAGDLSNNPENVKKADEEFAKLSKIDNSSQLKDEFLTPLINQQHNISLSGAHKSNRYYTSLIYEENKGGKKGYNNQNIIFSLKDVISVSKRIRIQLGGTFSFGKSKYSNVRSSWFDIRPYDLLRDEKGIPLPVNWGLSQTGLDYLKSIGAKDETYIPINELDKYDDRSEMNNSRIYADFEYKLADGLKFNVKYNYGNYNSKYSVLFDKNSYEVSRMINRYTTFEDNNGEKKLTNHIPEGDQYKEERLNRSNYSLRTQLSYNKTFTDHSINAIIGAERSEFKNSYTRSYKYGFDKLSLLFRDVDYKTLANFGNFNRDSKLFKMQGNKGNFEKFSETVNRYVAFYMNGAYTYKERYSVTGSYRIDQSNLFGTDPKYRYTPLWSTGVAWTLSNEDFFNIDFINRLQLRATYGINGNISQKSGPYLVLQRGRSHLNKKYINRIHTSPNRKLRWERTTIKNIGINFALINNRITGSFDYYNKVSKDVLGYVKKDPTLGVNSFMENSLSIINKGYEISLNTINVRVKDFEWSTHFTFNHNINRVEKVYNDNLKTAVDWVMGNNNSKIVNAEGCAMGSVYSYKWGGLSKTGDPQVYDAKGTIVEPKKYDDMNDHKALVNSGTIRPIYSAGFTNRFEYKGLSVSAMFILKGGHVMRNDIWRADYGSIHKDAAKRWKKPGDEKKTDIPRIPYDDYYYGSYSKFFYQHADIHILDATYIKLRELTVNYNLSKSVLKKTPFSRVAFSAQARNLWYWAANKEGIDPESHSYAYGIRNLPVMPTYSFGLKISF